jgi:CheY-like chemotaxis protein
LAEGVRQIRAAAEHSAELTRQLLAFARKQPVAPRVIDLNEAIAGQLKMLRRLIGENIELVWAPGSDLRPIRIDPGQLDQILTNLCVNARDAIAGTGRVTIETARVVIAPTDAARPVEIPPGEYATLVVSDTGHGMDQETLAPLFEPFFTTKELGRGTGLGLATVYGIVKQNQGFILVDSRPGHGTVFRIFFPPYGERSAATTLDRRPAPGGAQTTSPPAAAEERPTILLVEDEAALLTLTRKMLEGLGYRVLAAVSPGQALELARAHTGRIDLLLTDVVMPDMNGRELAHALQAHHPALKSCFMFGYTAEVIAQHGVLEPGVVFLHKPFTRQDLAEKVREALTGRPPS